MDIDSLSYQSVPTLCESSTGDCLTLDTECQLTDDTMCFNGCDFPAFRTSFETQKSPFDCDTILEEHGYHRLNRICNTLQGELILAQTKCKDGSFQKVAIKRTNKELHKNKICIQDNDTNFLLDEDIISEGIILNVITNMKPPGNYIVNFIEFFQSDYDYYLVIEYIDSQLTLKQFCEKAHHYINKGTLDRKEWNTIIKYITWQLVVTLDYMHNTLNIAHLDLTMDNIMIEDGTFIIDEKDGKIGINRGVSIKIIDFGLALMFEPDEFETDRQSPQFQLNDKAPQIFNDQIYDATKADIWSLGIIVYKMMFNCSPYYIQSEDDTRYRLMIENNIDKVIKLNKLTVTKKLVSFLENMLKIDERERCHINKVLHHEWLRKYYEEYKHRL